MSDPVSHLRLPAEWEPQHGVMLTWPHAQSGWAEALDRVEPVFFAIAGAVARYENLLIVCSDRDQAACVKRRLVEDGADEARLYLHLVPSDDTWARDHAALTVSDNGRPRLLDFRFNGWGNKYPAERDDAINARLYAGGAFDDTLVQPVDLVLEGGSLDSDGEGTLLTTASCLLHPGRNPLLARSEIEARLKALLGARRVLWLEHGCIEGDDTDGHIDMLARFADNRTIVYQRCDETQYSCHASLAAMEAELRALRTAAGEPYRLVPLPWPRPVITADGERLPAGYANFLVINGAVLVPVYDDPADDIAIQVLQGCFPGRDIVPVNCLPVIPQHGSLHCLTMQFPAAVRFSRDPATV